MPIEKAQDSSCKADAPPQSHPIPFLVTTNFKVQFVVFHIVCQSLIALKKPQRQFQANDGTQILWFRQILFYLVLWLCWLCKSCWLVQLNNYINLETFLNQSCLSSLFCYFVIRNSKWMNKRLFEKGVLFSWPFLWSRIYIPFTYIVWQNGYFHLFPLTVGILSPLKISASKAQTHHFLTRSPILLA